MEKELQDDYDWFDRLAMEQNEPVKVKDSINIKDEFKNLIPPLSKDELDILEQSILENGITDPIQTWNGFIVDGHNRFDISKKHKITYAIKKLDFESEEDVKIYIINKQLGRRNINAFVKLELTEKLREELRKKGKENSGKRTDLLPLMVKGSEINENRFTHLGKDENEDEGLSFLELDKVNTQSTIAKITGTSKGIVSQFDKIKDIVDEKTKEKLRDNETTIGKVYSDIKKKELKEKYNKTLEKIELEIGKKHYRVIYADPPWKYNSGDQHSTFGKVQETTILSHYPSMTIKELCELPVKELTDENAVLFMWVTSPLLEESFEVIKNWGFKYKTSMVWDKVKHNVGHYISVRHELLLICTKGSCTPDIKKLFDSVITEERSEHSRKPESFREIIDTIYPNGNRIELFARKVEKDGWETWGNMS